MYKESTFAIDKTRPVIKAKYPYLQCQPVLGKAKQASEIDWLKVNLLYRCPRCRVMLKKFLLKRKYWERNPRPFQVPVDPKQMAGMPGISGVAPMLPLPGLVQPGAMEDGGPPALSDTATASQVRRLTKAEKRKRHEKKHGHAWNLRMHAAGTLAKLRAHRLHHPGKKGKHGAGASSSFDRKGRGKKGGGGKMTMAKRRGGNKKKRPRKPKIMSRGSKIKH